MSLSNSPNYSSQLDRDDQGFLKMILNKTEGGGDDDDDDDRKREIFFRAGGGHRG